MYFKILIAAFKAGVPIAVEKQQPIILVAEKGCTPGETEGIKVKKDGSKVTPGDLESQKVFIQTMVNEFAFLNKKITAVAEEKGLEEIIGLVDEDDADFRIIVDPIDGTGNFSKGLRSNLSEKESGYGWGSMIAIQKKNRLGWKTVAAGIYESSSLDKPKKLHGKIYIATEDVAGIRIFNFSNESESILQIRTMGSKIYISGGFIDISAESAFEEKMTELKKINLKCVAHSTISIINGHASTYFQENLFIHDVVPTAFLAEKMGLHVFIMPVFARNNISIKTDAYPFLVTEDKNLGEAIVEIYCQKKGYDLKNLMIKKGSFEDQHFKKSASNNASYEEKNHQSHSENNELIKNKHIMFKYKSNHFATKESYCGFKPGFLIGKHF